MKTLLIIGSILACGAFATAKPKSNVPTQTGSKKSDSVQKIDSVVSACTAQFSKEASDHGSLNQWIEQAPAETKGKTFRTATKTFGTWLEANILPDGQPVLYVVTNKATEEISFSQGCTSSVQTKPGMDFSSLQPDKLATWYRDEAFKNDVQKAASGGLVYVWSPEMVYSAKFFKYFRDVAKKKNLKFIALIDPRTTAVLVGKAEQKYAIPPSSLKLDSVELYMRNVTVHYPSAVVFKNGKVHESVIVGVMEPNELEQQVDIRLREL